MKKISLLTGIIFAIMAVSIVGSVAAQVYPQLSINPSGTVWTINFDLVDINVDDVDVTTLLATCYVTGGIPIRVTPVQVLTINGELILIFKAIDLPTDEVLATRVDGETYGGTEFIATGPGFAWGRR